MTQIERLMARIKKLCADNPGRIVGIRIVTDRNGDPFMWFVDYSLDAEGNDEKLIGAGIKSTARN